ncbi:discoidin domain-containing protein [Paenibacillus sp. IB182496]|uniref:Discoidin domain-containing protein n=1 Tax=Paenibacillus sabuli TaxID=2772509 RepID=A0A927BTW4_9BACL|nr:Ig-like domain-containing protein [Paenibacillus sabuli]MBD2845318.1 discoidin domain-containing protein [Paenibacillus sabuli]
MVVVLIGSSVPISFTVKSAQAASTNLLTNGDFEDFSTATGGGWTDWQADGWTTYFYSGDATFTVDQTVRHSGDASVKIEADDTSRAKIGRYVSVEEGAYYDVEGWIKTANLVTEASGTRIRIMFYNASNQNLEQHVMFGALQGTQDWTRVHQRIQPPEGAVKMIVEAFIWLAEGEVWFDDLSVRASTNLLTNGDFEDFSTATGGGWTDWQADGWTTYFYSGDATFTVDQTVRHSGDASVKIEADDTSRAKIGRYVSVEEGAYYDVEGWIKTANLVTEASGTRIRIMFYNASNQNLEQHVMFGDLQGTQDWTRVQQRIQPPEGAVKMIVEAFIWLAEGEVWFDDLSVQQVTPVTGVALDQRTGVLDLAESLTLAATILPANATYPELVWSSSNPTVAEVTYDGTVTGVSPGMAVVTAQAVDGLPNSTFIVSVDPDGYDLPSVQYTALTDQSQAISGQLSEQDGSGHPLSYEVMEQPSGGWLHVGPSGAWTYVPHAAYTGEDRFVVTVVNGDGGLGSAEVTIQVGAINHSPSAGTIPVQTRMNVPISGNVEAYDADQDALQYSVATAPERGTASIDASGTWSYTPDTDEVGADRFTVSVEDEHGADTETDVQVYIAPTGADMITKLTAVTAGAHPRLMIDSADVTRMQTQVLSDPNMAAWYANVKSAADDLLAAPVSDNEANMLDTARTILSRVQTLALTYLISEDTTYAERAWDELETAADFDHWNPSHFLDTAEMTHAFAIGYDWLYHYWSSARRDTLRTAIVDKGLEPALSRYNNETWWSYSEHNWNGVIGGGIGMGALAIGDESTQLETLAGDVLAQIMSSVPIMLASYSPEGGWSEGPMYWRYGTRYIVYLIDSLDSALQTDYDLSSLPGLASTFDYLMHVNGAQGAFNYSDANPGDYPSDLALWFADRYDNSDYVWYHRNVYDAPGTGGVFDMIYYRDDLYSQATAPETLDGYFRNTEMVDMRSDWLDPYRQYVGFAGGDNRDGEGHAHLDLGSFVYDALGQRWALDLGGDSYSLPGYSGSSRWSYYRLRAEGHNTLVMNPGSAPEQQPTAKAVMERVESAPQGALAIADLTQAYQQDALLAKRGVKLMEMRKQFMVQDEFLLREPSELYWFMHTTADIDIIEEGRAAVLQLEDKKLYVKAIEAPANAQFEVLNARPLASSPDPEGQALNQGIRKLALHMDGVQQGSVSIWMVPLWENEALPVTAPEFVPLSEWTLPEGELEAPQPQPQLDDLRLDGETIEGFDPAHTYYEVVLPYDQTTIPSVTATSSVYGVSVDPAGSLPGRTVVHVTDTVYTERTHAYTVSFVTGPRIGDLPPEYEWPISAVTASASPQADQGYTPDKTIDGNLGTRWSASGEQWLQYDLGESRAIGSVSIAYLNGDSRNYYLDILASSDGESWEMLLSTRSSGMTSQPELFVVPETSARYIRVLGRGFAAGLSSGNWNSVTEVSIFKPE